MKSIFALSFFVIYYLSGCDTLNAPNKGFVLALALSGALMCLQDQFHI